MFYYLYYYVTINESKEKFRVFFAVFSDKKKGIFLPSSSSNFPNLFVEDYLYLLA